MTFSRGDFWYAPNVKVNDIQDGPFGSGLSANDEESYYDFVFLKSLKWDSNNMTVNSSIDNIKSKDILLNDALEINQDIADYKKMQTLKDIDISNTSSLIEGVSLLNNYLNNGILGFDINGYIPTRETYFSSLSKNNFNDVSRQTVIYPIFIDSSLKEYLSINLHWYTVDLNLTPRFISGILIYLINNSLVNIKSKIWGKEVSLWIDLLSSDLSNHLYIFSKELITYINSNQTFQKDVTKILSPIYNSISWSISKLIGKEIKRILNEKIINSKIQNFDTIYKIFQWISTTSPIYISDYIKYLSFDLGINLNFILNNTKLILKPFYPLEPYQIPESPNNKKLWLSKNDVLSGYNNDFIFSILGQDWNNFVSLINKKKKPSDILKEMNIFNPNIIFTSNEWINIIGDLLMKSGTTFVENNYELILKVYRGKLFFSNLNANGTTDIKENSQGQKLTIIAIPNIVSKKIMPLFQNFDLIIDDYQFGLLISDYKYDVDNWNEISKKYPHYTFPYQYFINSELMNSVNIESNVDLFNIDPNFNKENFWYGSFMFEFNHWCYELFSYKNPLFPPQPSPYSYPLFKVMVNSTNLNNNFLTLTSYTENLFIK